MAPGSTSKRKHSHNRKKGVNSANPNRAAAAARASSSTPSTNAQASSKPPAPRKRRAEQQITKSKQEEPDTELVFEDPYGDEFEEEQPELASPDTAPSIIDPMRVDDAVVFRPGRDRLADGEKLICDETAYEVFKKCTVEWPALSFDFVCTSAAGEYNNQEATAIDTYPMSISLVMGTQADRANRNKLVCLRMSNIHRNKGAKRGILATTHHDSESESSDEEDDSEDEGEKTSIINREPILQSAEIRMDSTINRVRAMPQRANIIAAWTESGRVCLVDAAPALDTLHLDSRLRMRNPGAKLPSQVRPFYAFNGHRKEGFGLDWSRVSPGRLLSGAVDGTIYLSEPATAEGASWTANPSRFRGHARSVEDIQWSPNEANVFASCSSDCSVRFWDAREYRRSALSIDKAHDVDVNVISWNRNETHLMASGGDDGVIRVWDLRLLEKGGGNGSAKPAAEFVQHQKAITAVQWHPRDASMLCASSEDDTVSIWDLAVERDAEEELKEGVVLTGADEFPPQLLFIHMGQSQIKDAQWHPACPSLVVSTAMDGLNAFQAANIALPA